LKLEVPDSPILADGSTVEVKGITAKVIDGKLEQIAYTVEKANGAWTDVSGDEIRTEADLVDVPVRTESDDRLEVQQAV